MMLAPDAAVAGPVFVIETSAITWTVVVAVDALFADTGSFAAEIVAVFETLPALFGALTTSVKVLRTAGIDRRLQLMVPFAPGAGVVHDQPPGAVSETNVVPAGSGSLSVTLIALPGPAFVTWML